MRFYKGLIGVLLFLFLIIGAFNGNAQALTFGTPVCFFTWTSPYTPRNIVNVTGTITMHYTYTCNPGNSIDSVALAFGCADSLTSDHSCPLNWVNPFPGSPPPTAAYLAPQSDTGTITWNTAQLPPSASAPNLVVPDQKYDINVWGIKGGIIIGGASSSNGTDLDAVINTQNGNPLPTPTPSPTPNGSFTALIGN